jgi:hypothetical protein
MPVCIITCGSGNQFLKYSNPSLFTYEIPNISLFKGNGNMAGMPTVTTVSFLFTGQKKQTKKI